MAQYNGSGWHNQSIRHSNARKYGKAGGTYLTKKRIDYQMAGMLGRWVVPKGTKVEPATNLPDKNKFWVVPDERMPKKTRELAKGMGILLEKDEVEKTPKAGWYDIGHSHYGKTKSEYDFFEDPAHGWLKVPKAELERLGIAGKISGFSYMSKDNAYLEEDSDATMFINAKKSIGEEVKIKEHITDNDSPVRRKQGYYNITPELKTQIEQMRNDMLKTKEWDAKTTRKINNASERQLRFWKERGLY
jgi:hypothetical protein